MARRRRLDDELEEEIRQHIQSRRQSLIADGMDPREAEYEARRMFGNVALKREEARSMWGYQWIDNLAQDVRYGIRLLRRSPVFAVVAVVSLAIGIGASAAVFTLADSLLFKKLPVASPDELVILKWIAGPKNPASSLSGNFDNDGSTTTSTSFSAATVSALRTDAARAADVFGFATVPSLDLTIDGQSEVGNGQVVSGNYFSTLGILSAAGRLLVDADDRAGAAPVAVISHAFWVRRFGAGPDVVGKTILVNRVPVTIVGVAPKGFHGAFEVGDSPLLTMPIAARSAIAGRTLWNDPGYWWVLAMARLRPGVSPEAAHGVLEGSMKRTVAEGNPALTASELPRLQILPGARGQLESRGSRRDTLVIMASVVGIVLLVACANVASLLLVRGTSRVREVTLRAAIGASRRRIVRQLLTEGVLLALAGSALGLLVANIVAAALLPVLSGSPIEAFNIRTDWRVFLFTAAIATACSLLFGLIPSLRTTSVDLVSGLQEQMRGHATAPRRARFTSVLVVFQVALSVLLITIAGLLAYSIRNLQRAPLGFDASNVLIFRVDPARAGYELPRTRALLEQVRERLRGIPGVRSASFSTATLISGGGSSGPAVPLDAPITERGSVEDRDLSRRYSSMRMTVGDEFFDALGISILRGRTFIPGDTAGGQPVVVINRALARRLFGDEDAVGRQFRWGTTKQSVVMEVIGVCADAKYTSLRIDPPPTLYTSYRQFDIGGATFEVKTDGDPAAIVAQARDIVRQLDSNLPLAWIRTQEDQIRLSLQSIMWMATFATALAIVAIVLAAIGLYGTLAYSVSQRVPEIGIRVALGAQRQSVEWLVLKSALALTTTGVALGACASYWGTGLVRSVLFGLTPTDRSTFLVAALLMTTVATAAAYLPARRAARIDPVEALRAE
ncbi:MAG TPA: ABC transporter permease [Vicinamibacterales bacterium]